MGCEVAGELIMAEMHGKITVRIWDAWIEDDIVCGLYEILELNKIVYAERPINDNNQTL